jgi:L-malate glycosyltransferase
MRVLHLDSGREMRGGQWQVLRLHRGLTEAGHESVLLAREASPLLEIARQWGLQCDVLRPLRLALLTRRFDLVHAHDARSHTLGAIFARPPLIVSRRVAFSVRRSLVSKWKYKRPALFLAISEHVAGRLKEAGVSGDRIAVVYDGVPVPPHPSEGYAFLTPYTEDPAKGMALAGEAAKLAGLTLEYSRNLEADLSRARVFLYLSRSEGLGSGILLAMACGVTVIASNVGGIPELIRNGVNGILVPNEPAAIAQVLTDLSSGSDRQFGHAARQTVLERFTEQHMLQATLAAYSRILHV